MVTQGTELQGRAAVPVLKGQGSGTFAMTPATNQDSKGMYTVSPPCT
jgi:hypothetical protein